MTETVVVDLSMRENDLPDNASLEQQREFIETRLRDVGDNHSKVYIKNGCIYVDVPKSSNPEMEINNRLCDARVDAVVWTIEEWEANNDIISPSLDELLRQKNDAQMNIINAKGLKVSPSVDEMDLLYIRAAKAELEYAEALIMSGWREKAQLNINSAIHCINGTALILKE